MNYQRIYNEIIANRKLNPYNGYTESHHILPESIFPEYADFQKNPWNCVNLSAREHFICHLLLTKIYDKGPAHHKMLNAFLLMSNVKTETQERYFGSYDYKRLKEEFSKLQSEKYMGKGITPIKSEEHKRKISAAHKNLLSITNGIENKKIKKNENIPEGWRKGITRKDKGCSKMSNRISITNGFDNRFIEKDAQIPDGWYTGMIQNRKKSTIKRKNSVWITNNVENRMIQRTDMIPEGWKLGRAKNNKISKNNLYMRITNGVQNKTILKTDKIPEGWRRGFTYSETAKSKFSPKGKLWINDGIVQTYINKNDKIPDGWNRGMLRKNE